MFCFKALPKKNKKCQKAIQHQYYRRTNNPNALIFSYVLRLISYLKGVNPLTI